MNIYIYMIKMNVILPEMFCVVVLAADLVNTKQHKVNCCLS